MKKLSYFLVVILFTVALQFLSSCEEKTVADTDKLTGTLSEIKEGDSIARSVAAQYVKTFDSIPVFQNSAPISGIHIKADGRKTLKRLINDFNDTVDIAIYYGVKIDSAEADTLLGYVIVGRHKHAGAGIVGDRHYWLELDDYPHPASSRDSFIIINPITISPCPQICDKKP